MDAPEQPAFDEETRFASERAAMVETQIVNRGITDPAVVNAMRVVPRHLFIPPDQREQAYADGPLPIGAGQTISQPYIVGLMTQILRLKQDDKVLEIGVGSGYQTAILCEIVREVIGIERIKALATRTEQHLHAIGYSNFTIIVDDGTLGYPAEAPYDAVLVAAAGPHIPSPLLDQLAEGGRLIIPVGKKSGDQTLTYAYRKGGTIHIESLGPVRFVPLVGEHGV